MPKLTRPTKPRKVTVNQGWIEKSFLQAMKQTYFTSDTVREIAEKKYKVPSHEVSKVISNLMKTFQADGYIVQTKQFIRSARSNQRVLPLWTARRDSEQLVL